MKSQKDISSVIRESEKKLTVQPSPRAWQKLERKLDRRRHNGRIVNMKWMAMAAAFLVLIMSIYYWNASQNNYDYKPTFVEELKGSNDCNPFCMNIKAIKALPEFYSVPDKEEVSL